MSDPEERSQAFSDAVDAILVQHDPADLMVGCGCPGDEVVAAILARLDEAADANDLRSIVHRVFQDFFGWEMCGPEENYQPMAQKIWALRQQTPDLAGGPAETPSGNEEPGRVCTEEAGSRTVPQGVTRLLNEWSAGATEAIDEVLPMISAKLHYEARRKMRGERAGHTLEPHDLVQEVWVRLLKRPPKYFPNQKFFFAVARRQMDQILKDWARQYRGQKRFPPGVRQDFTKAENAAAPYDREAQALADAYEVLEKRDPTLYQILDRHHEGFTQKEIAEKLGLPVRKVAEEIRMGEAWLSVQVKRGRYDARQPLDQG